METQLQYLMYLKARRNYYFFIRRMIYYSFIVCQEESINKKYKGKF
jgi:hypothetical protein